MIDMKKFRSLMKKQMQTNPKIMEILMKEGIDPKNLDSMSDEQLEKRISAKMMGMMGMSMKDIEM